jgi:hypothetical protein
MGRYAVRSPARMCCLSTDRLTEPMPDSIQPFTRAAMHSYLPVLVSPAPRSGNGYKTTEPAAISPNSSNSTHKPFHPALTTGQSVAHIRHYVRLTLGTGLALS